MSEETPQFGIEPEGECAGRSCAYAVLFNDDRRLLALRLGQTYHLPGGGIDPSEDAASAVVREAREEAGCEIADLQFLGRANQYFPTTEIGPLNKLGAFYEGRITRMDPSKGIEAGHEICWLTHGEFLDSSSSEFQKWAVRKAVNKQILSVPRKDSVGQ
jgi:8-oxo-dGTP diphosphatase